MSTLNDKLDAAAVLMERARTCMRLGTPISDVRYLLGMAWLLSNRAAAQLKQLDSNGRKPAKRRARGPSTRLDKGLRHSTAAA